MVYNMGSGILRAVGDTKRPLYFLIFSSITNIVLDLIFVIVFDMGVAGVAYATIISQFLSAVLVMILLTKTTEIYQFIWKDLHIDRPLTGEILSIGFPVGFQQAITAFSNIYVQSYINGFGSGAMAGWSSFIKIDSFMSLPIQSLAQAGTTFSSQNIGAKNISRVKEGVKTALVIGLPVVFLMASVLFFLAPNLISFFNQDLEVVHYGTLFMRLNVFFRLFMCVIQILAGTMRGAGCAKTPMYIFMFSYIWDKSKHFDNAQLLIA